MRLMSSSTTFVLGRVGPIAACSQYRVQPCEAASRDLISSSFLFPKLPSSFCSSLRVIFPLNASHTYSLLSSCLPLRLLYNFSLHISLFSLSVFLSHCHFVLTPSPQSLPSSSSGDEVELFDGVLPLAGKSHPSGVGVASDRPCSTSASTVSPVGFPAAVHAHPRHGGGAAFVVVAWRRVGVHLNHVMAVHGRRGADVLLRLGLLVVAEPTHRGHHPTSRSSVTSANHQAHRHQPVLQTIR